MPGNPVIRHSNDIPGSVLLKLNKLTIKIRNRKNYEKPNMNVNFNIKGIKGILRTTRSEKGLHIIPNTYNYSWIIDPDSCLTPYHLMGGMMDPADKITIKQYRNFLHMDRLNMLAKVLYQITDGKFLS